MIRGAIRSLSWAGAMVLVAASPLTAAELSLESVNSAVYQEDAKADPDTPQPFLIRLQILLDRANISPGVIDGLPGDNVAKAVRAYEEREGLEADGKVDEKLWSSLTERDQSPVLETYKVTPEDLAEKYVEKLPEDYAKLAEMKWLGYRGPREMLAERFHMDEDLLRALNPKADFNAKGSEIVVANPGKKAEGKVSRITVYRSRGQVYGFDRDEKLLVVYPATIGSKDSPSPTGVHKVKGVAMEPTYSYRPDVNFQQGSNDEPLKIPAGPNGPVGLVWIDLSEPTYGIHGTADPELIDKTQSHGCVRLTNWDADELAHLVKPQVPVEFKD